MPVIKNDDGEDSNTDRFAAQPGEMFVYDDETGLRERIGEVPAAAKRRIKLREASAALDKTVRRAKLSSAVDEVGRLGRRALRLVRS